MSKSQGHGNDFEARIKSSGGISSRVAATRVVPSFDILGKDDTEHGYPTSIKSTGSARIDLADARRFWNSFDYAPYRIIVGKYDQKGTIKKFVKIHEFIIQEDHRRVFCGSVNYDEIRSFHEDISLSKFPEGQHEEARERAQELKSSLEDRLGLVMLNRKIDSKRQRRLQCSVNLPEMIDELKESYVLHTGSFGSLKLPFPIPSGKRQRNKTE